MSFDFYHLLRPFLFCLAPETAHALALGCLKKNRIKAPPVAADDVLKVRFCGHDFAHPIGLAAGMDKHAEAIEPLYGLGFSFVELGGVTPLPQPGNAKPRLFRIRGAKAIINRFGFNSVGADVFRRRLGAYQDTRTKSKHRFLGVNLGKNKDTVEAADDYVKGVATFAGLADFLTVNISSPNTPGLRDMQGRAALSNILRRVLDARAASGAKPLLFIKIAPDITEDQAKDIAEIALEAKIDGIIVSNTTISRPPVIPGKMAKESGGLSGKPLFALSTKVLGQIYQLTGGAIPLVGVGGIFNGADAYAKIRAGASLVQLYTALIYEGPHIVPRIAAELAVLLKRDGFASIADAVGADFKK